MYVLFFFTKKFRGQNLATKVTAALIAFQQQRLPFLVQCDQTTPCDSASSSSSNTTTSSFSSSAASSSSHDSIVSRYVSPVGPVPAPVVVPAVAQQTSPTTLRQLRCSCGGCYQYDKKEASTQAAASSSSSTDAFPGSAANVTNLVLPPFCYIESSNDVSRRIFSNLGFQKVADVMWVAIAKRQSSL